MFTESIKVSQGTLTLSMLGHASLLLQANGANIYVDPYSVANDYTGFPPADLILITHDHYDHFDPSALIHITTVNTQIITTSSVAKAIKAQKVATLSNGESLCWHDVTIEALPAYNIHRINPEINQPFHPKGEGNGYILTLLGLRIYIAGDTELIPEMQTIKDIDIAFLPKMLPYTMETQELIEVAKTIRPKILYPYHYTTIDLKELSLELPNIDIRPQPSK